MTAGSKFAFKMATKPLQIKTWLLLTAIKTRHRPIQRYHRRLHTACRLATLLTERQTTYRTKSLT